MSTTHEDRSHPHRRATRSLYGGVEPEGIRVYRGTPFVAWEPTETVIPFTEAHLLAPVFPTKVVAIGRNYVDHAAERSEKVPEEPLIFLKPATAVIGPLASDRASARDHRCAPRGRVGRGDRQGHPQGGHRGRGEPHPRATRLPTTSRPVTSRTRTASGPGPRASTRSARWVLPSRPRSILSRASPSSAGSMGSCASRGPRQTWCSGSANWSSPSSAE